MTTQRTPVSVAIVGCGQIGTRWDRPHQHTSNALTHAAAFTRNPNSRLAAVCDRDESRAKEAAQRWGSPRAFTDVEQMFAHVSVDIVVIATSSMERRSIIVAALAAGVKILVIEKPLATTLEEAGMLMSELDSAGARTIVNFSRRWDPAMNKLRDKILTNQFGSIQRLVGFYGKGIVNNGSHMVDLVANLCNAMPVRVRSPGSPLPDSEASWSRSQEPTLDAQVEFVDSDGREFHLDLIGTDQSAFTCFELKVVGRTAICDVTGGGRNIVIKPVVEDPVFANYRIPGPAAEMAAGYMKSMENMAAEAVAMALGQVQVSSCDVHRAFGTAVAIEAIQRSAQSGGCWISL